MMALRSINKPKSQTCNVYPRLSKQLNHRPAALSPPTARLQRRHAGAVTASAYRTDLDPTKGPYSSSPPYGPHLAQSKALMPSFDPEGVISQPIPILLPMTIKEVKEAAIDVLRKNPSTTEIATTYDRLCKVDIRSKFVHPAGVAGAAELALMLYRIKNKQQPTLTASENLLSGKDVSKKVYDKGTPQQWYPPVDTPLTFTPHAIQNVQMDWGGKNVPPPNKNATEREKVSSHISFVELDGQQAYRQALAWWTTGDTRYADNALNIIKAWATTNKQWGIIDRNGPLEAGWGIASMSKALELLRFKQQTATNEKWDLYRREGQQVYDDYVSWVTSVMLPQLDDCVYDRTKGTMKKGPPNWLGNCEYWGGWDIAGYGCVVESG